MLILLSVDHRRASLAEREPFALTAERQSYLLRLVRRGLGGQVALLMTCNRAEVIAWVLDANPEEASDLVAVTARRVAHGLAESFLARAATYAGPAATRHLFRVAAGLEAQVQGEIQVLGQVRQAYRAAAVAGTVGPELHRLFQTALRAGKRVHSQTAFGRERPSIGRSAVADLARRLGDLAGRRVAIVGAGSIGRITARALAPAGARLTILNRDPSRAAALAGEVGALWFAFDRRHEVVAEADAAVIATAARTPVIQADALSQARRASGRERARLELLDLALPRNVTAAVASLPGISLTDLAGARLPGAPPEETRLAQLAAERIVEEEVATFTRWLGSREGRPAVVA